MPYGYYIMSVTWISALTVCILYLVLDKNSINFVAHDKAGSRNHHNMELLSTLIAIVTGNQTLVIAGISITKI